MMNLHRRDPLTFAQMIATLKDIEAICDWLTKNQVCVLGFRCSRSGPVVTVAPHPKVYALAKGDAERGEFRQVGALRHECWSFKTRRGVLVCWEDVRCVH